MNIDDMMASIDDLYKYLCNEQIHSKPLSIHDIEDLKYSNRQLHQDLYFQEYLQMHALASIVIYHDYLRETLLKCARIDIGEIDDIS